MVLGILELDKYNVTVQINIPFCNCLHTRAEQWYS